MVIQSGILNYGAQLPIPEGFKEEECVWFVSAKTLHKSWQGAAIDFYRESYCVLDNNRVNKSYTAGDLGRNVGIPIYYIIFAQHGAKLKGTNPRILEL